MDDVQQISWLMNFASDQRYDKKNSNSPQQ